ncbi:MAG: molybdenum cofactor biosynthesis protein MoaE [Sphingobacteriaceae bacterium]|nr:molybdenum cofactor biosynthesis protein MoaE [Sphingobacteriaceae bacterium]
MENWYNFTFINGPISSKQIGSSIEKYSSDLYSGAYNIFLGQVRQDKIQNQNVEAIHYTSNVEMAKQIFHQIAIDAKKEIGLNHVNILHSLETVKKGEICLMVIVTCQHREDSFKACKYIVERLKKEVPIWGQEIFENKTHTWKVNK